MTHAIDFTRRVVSVTTDGYGYGYLELTCGHTIQLDPTGNEPGEQKRARFQGSVGTPMVCARCHKLSHEVPA